MLTRIHLFAAMACVAIVGFSTTARADEIDFQKIERQMNGLDAKTISLRRFADSVPTKYSNIRSQLVKKADKLEINVQTVTRFLAILRQNPTDKKPLLVAIKYSDLAAKTADDLESLLHDLKRAAGRDKNDSLKDAARSYKKLADDVHDRMRRITKVLD